MFDIYNHSKNVEPLHPYTHRQLKAIASKCTSVLDCPNLIIYGPRASGRKTLAHTFLRDIYQTPLKYKRSITINISKRSFTVKLSEHHVEVDLSNILNNCRQNWEKIFSTIVDITLSSKLHSNFIVLCNIEQTNHDILNCLYAYMQNLEQGVTLRYILITSSLIVLPTSITSRCKCIRVKLPSASKLAKYLSTETRNCKRIEPYTTLYNFPFGIPDKSINLTTIVKIVTSPSPQF